MWGTDEPSICELDPPTYAHRVDNPDIFNFCPIPGGGEDVFLFAALAAAAACLLHFSKLSAVLVLLAGAATEAVVYSFNLGRLGNAYTLWLGASPPELLLYGFLPPLLLDSAMCLDWHVFKRVSKYSVVYAFAVVLLSTAAMTPFLLYGLNLSTHGWKWQHGALFASTLASTDALAVAAIINNVGGPEELTVLMEGESLFNDASSLVLFVVFLEGVKALEGPGDPAAGQSLWALLLQMGARIGGLAAGGAAVGLVLGWITLRLLRILRATGAASQQEIGLIHAMAYGTFYLANAPLRVSGVIAVVSFALYGAATSKFELGHSQFARDVDAVQGALSEVLNGLVFFLAGASAVNFLFRAVPTMEASLGSFVAIPAIYVAMFLVRWASIYLLNGAFWAVGSVPLSMQSVAFVTWGGLRGALTLIMAMVVAAEQTHSQQQQGVGGRDPQVEQITAQMVAWASAFVLCTLCINAPTMPAVLRTCGLLDVPRAKRRMQIKALRALAKCTQEALAELRHDEDELLQGVDWAAVERLVSPEDPTSPAADSPPPETEFPTRARSSLGGEITRQSMQASLARGAPLPDLPPSSSSAAEQAQPLLSVHVAEPSAEVEVEVAEQGPCAGSNETPFLTKLQQESPGGTGAGRAPATSLMSPAAPAGGGAVQHRHVQFDMWSEAGSSVAGGSPRALGSQRSFEGGPASPMDALRPTESELAGAYGDFLGSRGMSQALRPPHVAIGGEARVEARVRLIGGLKRYVFKKRAEGLLSPEGTRLLGYACDEAIDRPERPMALWRGIQGDLANRLTIRLLVSVYHGSRRLAYSLPPWAQRLAVPLVRGATAWMGSYLGKAMLRSCEVAVAYFMALTYSHQVQWLQQAGQGSSLMDEVVAERERVSKFIVDREVEAPSHFQAIQTYRASMAVLWRQRNFVDTMFAAGVVDEGEKHSMEAPIRAKIRALEATGPNGRSWPSARDVLRSVPFLADLPDEALESTLRRGRLRECAGGEEVWTQEDESRIGTYDASGSGLVIVIRGLVKHPVAPGEGVSGSAAGEMHRYLGSGSVLGLLPAVTGGRASLPNAVPVIAEASPLQKGVLVFHLPAAVLVEAREEAEQGSAVCQRMELMMHREAAIQVAEALGAATTAELAAQWQAAETERRHRLQEETAASDQAGRASGKGPVDAAGYAAEASRAAESPLMGVQAQRYGQRVMEALRRQLHSATIVKLGPYQRHEQRSAAVLLAGSVQAQHNLHPGPTERPWFQRASAPSSSGIIPAPAVLPLPVGAIDATPVKASLLAGHRGALLMVCPASLAGSPLDREEEWEDALLE